MPWKPVSYIDCSTGDGAAEYVPLIEIRIIKFPFRHKQWRIHKSEGGCPVGNFHVYIFKVFKIWHIFSHEILIQFLHLQRGGPSLNTPPGKNFSAVSFSDVYLACSGEYMIGDRCGGER